MSPLWTEKKLVHFLSIWGPLILSHGHINSATEKARAWQHSQPSVSSGWHYGAGGRPPSNAGQQDGVPLGLDCPAKGRGDYFQCLLSLYNSILPNREGCKILTSFTSSKTMNPTSPGGQVSCGRGLWLRSQLSKGKQVTLVNSEPSPHWLGLPGASRMLGALQLAGGRKSLSYEDKDPSGSLCNFRAHFCFPLWWGSRFQTAFKHNTVPSKEEMKPFKSSVSHVVPSPAAFRLTEAFC